jgi:hypothetical protein
VGEDQPNTGGARTLCGMGQVTLEGEAQSGECILAAVKYMARNIRRGLVQSARGIERYSTGGHTQEQWARILIGKRRDRI